MIKIEQRGVEDVDEAFRTILDYDPLIGDSEAIQRLKSIISKIAALDTTVMIYGESGTGKEIVARLIHANSPAADEKFIPVHAAGIPNTLLESALFGHDKGVFKNQKGYFEMARTGVLFLDGIEEIDARTQLKLLRTFQNEKLNCVGRTDAIQSKARFIGATNKNLKKLVKNGDFRQDLFYRLNIITLEIPPLRERREDIPLLARHFVQKYSKKHHLKGIYVLPESVAILQQYDWPGNVRELENIIEQLVLSSDSKQIDIDRPSLEFFQAESTTKTSDQFLPVAKAKAIFKHDYMVDALRRSQGAISTSEGLAQLAKQNWHTKINKYGFPLTYTNKIDSLAEIDCLN